jgi:hypothetical protein
MAFLFDLQGIPYSPPVDPWVVLKRQFMDDNGRIPVPPNSSALTTAQAFTAGSSVLVYPPPKQHAAPVTPSVRRVTGQEWYEQSAIRAVNQVLLDFVSVFECDGILILTNIGRWTSDSS